MHNKYIITALMCLWSIVPAFSFATETSDKVTIVASTTQIADFAREIAGDRCDVRCILAPGADPHTYQPTPDDIKMVMGTDMCLQNGLHLEGGNWMKNLADDAGKPVFTCTEGIKAIEIEESGHSIADPHAWFSPINVAVYVNNITKALISIDPEGREQYIARTQLYLQQLKVLDSWIRQQINNIPVEQRILVTSHDAFNYFCIEYKFNKDNNYLSLAPVGWSTGSEVGGGMTPKRRQKVISGLKETGAKAVFVETSVNPKLIKEIAREAGIKIGGELYSDSMGEADTAGEKYIGMMRENVILIVEALKTK